MREKEARKAKKEADKKKRYDAWLAKQPADKQAKIEEFKKQGKKGLRKIRKMHRIDKTVEEFKADDAENYEEMKQKRDKSNRPNGNGGGRKLRASFKSNEKFHGKSHEYRSKRHCRVAFCLVKLAFVSVAAAHFYFLHKFRVTLRTINKPSQKVYDQEAPAYIPV